MIPLVTLIRSLAHILADRRAELRRVPTTPARERTIAHMSAQLRRLGAMLRGKPKGDVPPAIAGYLCAWATGHAAALFDLDGWMHEHKHPNAGCLADLQSEDYAGAIEEITR